MSLTLTNDLTKLSHFRLRYRHLSICTKYRLCTQTGRKFPSVFSAILLQYYSKRRRETVTCYRCVIYTSRNGI
jgi:hypothetical protein